LSLVRGVGNLEGESIQLVKEPPRISVFTGPFGTGKTEVAINYALSLTGRDEAVTLIDMDVVTPYFRSREMAEPLAKRGVEVVAPAEITKYVHLPAITARMWGALRRDDGFVVMDVGGDSQGSRAIGQFKSVIEGSGYVMYFVVNPYRPFHATIERIAQTLGDIEVNSRLRAGALVSNPNLIAETTLQVVDEGHRIVEQASDTLGLPIAFLCIERRLLGEGVEERYSQPVLPLGRHFRPPWDEEFSK
jgi:hypothetical protein